ncbi:RNA-binding domain-containing protein [Neobacillus drentensis]|uniref:RNA-binding domain-containing protein n=1 Tax=Neobacillus drentensis TaxID=220684 RepID=UPI002FFE4008
MEFKRGWWDFNQQTGINEFLKDITARANTSGDTGYIIIGIDKNGNFYDSPIPKDPIYLRGLVLKRVHEAMDFEVYPYKTILQNAI